MWGGVRDAQEGLKTRPRNQPLSPLPAPRRALRGGSHQHRHQGWSWLHGQSQATGQPLPSRPVCGRQGSRPRPRLLTLTPSPFGLPDWLPVSRRAGTHWPSSRRGRTGAAHAPRRATPRGASSKAQRAQPEGRAERRPAAHPSPCAVCPCCVHSLGWAPPGIQREALSSGQRSHGVATRKAPTKCPGAWRAGHTPRGDGGNGPAWPAQRPQVGEDDRVTGTFLARGGSGS